MDWQQPLCCVQTLCGKFLLFLFCAIISFMAAAVPSVFSALLPKQLGRRCCAIKSKSQCVCGWWHSLSNTMCSRCQKNQCIQKATCRSPVCISQLIKWQRCLRILNHHHEANQRYSMSTKRISNAANCMCSCVVEGCLCQNLAPKYPTKWRLVLCRQFRSDRILKCPVCRKQPLEWVLCIEFNTANWHSRSRRTILAKLFVDQQTKKHRRQRHCSLKVIPTKLKDVKLV